MRDRGVVLINALVVVIVIASVAAALLARSEAARVRAGAHQAALQIGFHLDAMQALALQVLDSVGEEGVVHSGQPWATETRSFDIGAGRVTGRFSDLQGRLNVNWLALPEDEYVTEVFRRVFADLGLAPGLIEEIRDYMRPGGPRSLPRYLRRSLPEQPRGGPVALLHELRRVTGMSAQDYEILSRHAAALPVGTRVNLNTASLSLLRALLHPLPPEVQQEFARENREEPIEHMRELRDMTIEILQTEDLEDLPFNRMTVTSQWFQADLTTELEGRVAARRVLVRRNELDQKLVVVHRWALRD